MLPLRLQADYMKTPSTPLQTWNGSFTYQSTNYQYVMVGQAPSGGLSTTVPTYLIPVKVIITTGTTQTVYNPAHVLANGNSVTKNTRLSPIFDKTTTYTQGSINVGTSQYVDAYQRDGAIAHRLPRAVGRSHGAGPADPKPAGY